MATGEPPDRNGVGGAGGEVGGGGDTEITSSPSEEFSKLRQAFFCHVMGLYPEHNDFSPHHNTAVSLKLISALHCYEWDLKNDIFLSVFLSKRSYEFLSVSRVVDYMFCQIRSTLSHHRNYI